ncbi:MAG: hypothetical protein N4A54_08460 [Peptostreptococcaceae bacterium]|jgi:hypothetical protein|nr:hypothetical protein [Peptostreptococcaceae bacterium]
MAKKKNGDGEGTIYQRADGKWIGQITIGRDPDTGKLKRKSLYGKRRRDVSEKMNKIRLELNLGTYDKDEKTTLGEWMLKLLDLYKKQNLKVGTYNSYYINIFNHITSYWRY